MVALQPRHGWATESSVAGSPNEVSRGLGDSPSNLVNTTSMQVRQESSANGESLSGSNLLTTHREYLTSTSQSSSGNNTNSNRRYKNNIKIASLNINGGGYSNSLSKWREINQLMREEKIAIITVQETHLTEIDTESLNKLFERQIRIFNSSNPINPTSTAGVAIVLNKSQIRTDNIKITTVIPGRALSLKINWTTDSQLNVLAIYAPNAPEVNKSFWQELHEIWIQKRFPKPDIVLGDFNVVEDSLDRLPSHSDPINPTTALMEFKNFLGVVDGWRHTFPTTTAYTFSQSGRPIHSRIDRIYIKERLLPLSMDWEMKVSPIPTDHKLIQFKLINTKDPYTGKGRWSIPSFVLENKEFITEIYKRGQKLQEGDTHHSRNIQLCFKSFKEDIIRIAKKYASKTATLLDKEILRKEHMLLTLQNSIYRSNDEKSMSINILQNDILEMKRQRHLRRRTDIATRNRLEGETISSYWINLNKEKKPRDTIYALRSPDGTLMKRSIDMANVMRSFLGSLQNVDINLNESPQDRENTIIPMLSCMTTRLDENAFSELSNTIETDEIRQTIKKLPNGKAAGLDGIPYELWKILAQVNSVTDRNNQTYKFDAIQLLHDVYKDIGTNGLNTQLGFNAGWLCPLYKKNERTDPGNYRPITVLNCDYRLLTRILTVRLGTIAPKLIHPDQAGFMKNRKITDQTELASLMVHYAETLEINGVIVSLDQEKAYDRIRHDFMWKSLQHLNFPESFINLVKTLYKNAETTIILNGEKSSPIEITRGVRQGDPLSCLLFNIAIESLACKLRNSDLRGFDLPGITDRLIASLFADDTTVYLSEGDSFETLQSILDEWCKASGAKFNLSKTNILPIGTPDFRRQVITSRKWDPHHREVPLNIPITNEGESVRILGCYIGNGVNQGTIWTPMLENISTHLKNWKRGKPTLEGKRLILNIEVGSRTQYLTAVQGMPPDVVHKIKTMIRNFLWEDKTVPPVNLETMHLDFSLGGKRCIDIEARNDAIEIVKLKRLLCNTEEPPMWTYIANDLINRSIRQDVPRNDPTITQNYFLQTWNIKTRGKTTAVPLSIKRMVKTSEKYNLSFDALEINTETKQALPIWYHIGLDTEAVNWKDKSYHCLRKKHKIQTTGDLLDFIDTIFPPNHNVRGACGCTVCKNTKSRTKCATLNLCHQLATYLLNKLGPKWDPRTPISDRSLINRVAKSDEWPENTIAFNPDVLLTNITDGYRIICGSTSPTNTPITREPMPQSPNSSIIYTDGAAIRNGQTNAIASSGIWYDDGDSRNKSLRLPSRLNTNNAGELAAILYAAQNTPLDENLTIKTDSEYTRTVLTTALSRTEDQGWLNSSNTEILQATVARLRTRSGLTYLTKVKGHSGEKGNEEADKLAKAGLDLETSSLMNLEIPITHKLTGIKLSTATQSILYKAILNKKNTEPRRKTEDVIDRIQSSVEDFTDNIPSSGEIWESYRAKIIPREIGNFLWRSTHDSYKLGRFWIDVPNLNDRAYCHPCGTFESMEHILTECDAIHTTQTWSLPKKIWEDFGYTWPEITYGIILGCNTINFVTAEGKKDSAKCRLFTTLVTETAFFLWTTRCRYKIQQSGAPIDPPSWPEIKNKWIERMSQRINYDINATNRNKFKKKSIPYKRILAVWAPILKTKSIRRLTIRELKEVLVGSINGRPP